MRMRKKKNLIPRMERCAAYQIKDPYGMRGRWRELMPTARELRVELGCGKGRFTAETAKAEPDVLFIAIERVPDAMVVAMERAASEELRNVYFIDADVNHLPDFFAPAEIDRIYINFCDPWPKSRDAKLRLTAPGFLRLYADVLPAGGEIWFKTDNAPLFDWSIERFREEGWALSEVTHDLHASGPVGIMTDYEAKFFEQGVKINRLVARRTDDTKTTAAGPVPRLRNASLSDARGAAKGIETAEEPRLVPRTRELCHAFYRELVQDPDLFTDKNDFRPWSYDGEKVDDLFDRQAARPDRLYYSVMLGETVIGEVYFKNIDRPEHRCEMGICLTNDRWKNRGLGTKAEKQALALAFGSLNMETVTAECLAGNRRSRRAAEKAGFRRVSEADGLVLYEISREEFGEN